MRVRGIQWIVKRCLLLLLLLAACGGTLQGAKPVRAPAEEWTWVDVPGTLCMNRPETGFGINPSSTSEDVLIVLEGGGACFDPVTCRDVFHQDGVDRAGLLFSRGLRRAVQLRSHASRVRLGSAGELARRLKATAVSRQKVPASTWPRTPLFACSRRQAMTTLSCWDRRPRCARATRPSPTGCAGSWAKARFNTRARERDRRTEDRA